MFKLNRQFFLFLTTGFLSFLIDFIILLSLYYLANLKVYYTFEVFGLPIDLKLANMISVTFSSTFGYLLQSKLTFVSTSSKDVKEKFRYFSVIMFNYFAQNIIFGYLTVRLLISAAITKILVIGLQTVWTYFLYKFFVFRKNR